MALSLGPSDGGVRQHSVARRLLTATTRAFKPLVRLFNNDLELAAVWAALRLCELDAELAGDDIKPRRRPTGRGLAHALRRPSSTTSLRVTALVNLGFCERTAAGLATRVPPHHVRALDDACVHASSSLKALLAEPELRDDLQAALSVKLLTAEHVSTLAQLDPARLQHAYFTLLVKLVRRMSTTLAFDSPDLFILGSLMPGGAFVRAQSTGQDRRPHAATSLRKLAAETGLPRETVRRRVNSLVDAGVLVRVGAAVVLPPDTDYRARHQVDVDALLEAFAALHRDLSLALADQDLRT